LFQRKDMSNTSVIFYIRALHKIIKDKTACAYPRYY